MTQETLMPPGEYSGERGKLITFEGGEGGGKTLQIGLLAAWLRESGRQVTVTREPGGTDIGGQIRDVLTKTENGSMAPRTEVLLFQASRAQLTDQVLMPELAAGRWVLMDRFFDSTLAYQGYGHGIELATLMNLINFATGGLRPDLTLLLDVDINRGLARKKGQGEWNRLDQMAVDFHRRVGKGFRQLAREQPERWRVINANAGIDEVSKQIRETVTAFFGLRAAAVLGMNEVK